MKGRKVAVITRQLSDQDPVVIHRVVEIPEDVEATGNFADSVAKSAKEAMQKKFVEFRNAEFIGEVHEVV